MKYSLLAMVGLMFTLSACIKEDLSQCPPEEKGSKLLQIVFSHNDEDGTDVIPASELKNAILYVFDANDRLVNFWEISNPELNTVYVPDFELVPENYSFVVWFNSLSPYTITPSTDNLLIGESGKSDGQFLLQIPTNRIIRQPATAFLRMVYGQQKQAIEDTDNNVVTIPVLQNTNRINISVNGLASTTHTYRFSIMDNNGIYNFDNDFALCAPFSYITETTYSESGSLNASLTVLRLAGNHPTPVLTIMDTTTSEMVFPNNDNVSNNLIELLKVVYPGNDFDKRHVYDLDIVFSGGEIWINGWKLVDSNTGLTIW